MTTSPPKKTRSPRKPSDGPERKRTAKKIEHAPTEKPVLVREDPEPYKEGENKYATRQKIGTPTLGRSPNFVTSVGLGKLEVVHAESAKFPYSENKRELNGNSNV